MSATVETPLEVGPRASAAPSQRYSVTRDEWTYTVVPGWKPREKPKAHPPHGDVALLVARMFQVSLGLIGLTGLFAAFWRPGVPLALSLAFIGTGLSEMAAFVAGLPRRVGPAIATGLIAAGVCGLLLLALSLIV